MASSENLEPWNFRPTFADSWLSEAFARDTNTLTRALQKSLSDNYDVVTGDDAFSPFLNTVKPETTSSLQTPSVSGSDPETPAAKRRNGVSNGKIAKRKSRASYDVVTGDDAFSPFVNTVKPETTSSLQTPSVLGSDPETPAAKRRNGVSNGKIAKRKSRASKRSTMTFITADPANFRQMVQQVTGVKLGVGQLPVSAVLKPEPQRAFNRIQGCLPTLDTSAFLLDHHQQVAGPTSAAIDQPGMGYTPPGVVAEGGAGFDFELFSGFPTLESWKVM